MMRALIPFADRRLRLAWGICFVAWFLALAGLVAAARAATTVTHTLTIILTGPTLTDWSCPIAGPFTAPVAPGTVICTIALAPAGTSAVISQPLGPQGTLFAVQGMNLVVGSTALTQASCPVDPNNGAQSDCAVSLTVTQ